MARCSSRGVLLLDDGGKRPVRVAHDPPQSGGILLVERAQDAGRPVQLEVAGTRRPTDVALESAGSRRSPPGPGPRGRPAVPGTSSRRARCPAAQPARRTPRPGARPGPAGPDRSDSRPPPSGAQRPRARSASSTNSTIGRPRTGHRTLGSSDFIRVPLPAARMIASRLLIESIARMDGERIRTADGASARKRARRPARTGHHSHRPCAPIPRGPADVARVTLRGRPTAIRTVCNYLGTNGGRCQWGAAAVAGSRRMCVDTVASGRYNHRFSYIRTRAMGRAPLLGRPLPWKKPLQKPTC